MMTGIQVRTFVGLLIAGLYWNVPSVALAGEEDGMDNAAAALGPYDDNDDDTLNENTYNQRHRPRLNRSHSAPQIASGTHMLCVPTSDDSQGSAHTYRRRPIAIKIPEHSPRPQACPRHYERRGAVILTGTAVRPEGVVGIMAKPFQRRGAVILTQPAWTPYGVVGLMAQPTDQGSDAGATDTLPQ